MSLIGMAIYSTEENKKDECLEQTLMSLDETVDFYRHRLILSVNAFTKKTSDLLYVYSNIIHRVIYNEENIGTARAINKAWELRSPGEHAIKCDDDFTTRHIGWADEMEEALRRDPKIGQVGLKRKDCWEYPGNPSPDHSSTLRMLPHVPGEAWMIVEKVKHVIGTCVMHSSGLLDKVGYLYQPSLYGYDDVIMSHRAYLAGFDSCFLPHIAIDHIDHGQTPYQDWKQRHSGEHTAEVIALVHAMYAGNRSIYYAANY